MTSRRSEGAIRRLLSLGIGLLLVIAACGDTADTTEDTPAPTEAPRQTDATTTTSPPEVDDTKVATT